MFLLGIGKSLRSLGDGLFRLGLSLGSPNVVESAEVSYRVGGRRPTLRIRHVSERLTDLPWGRICALASSGLLGALRVGGLDCWRWEGFVVRVLRVLVLWLLNSTDIIAQRCQGSLQQRFQLPRGSTFVVVASGRSYQRNPEVGNLSENIPTKTRSPPMTCFSI